MSSLPRHTAGQKGGKAPKKKAINRRATIDSEYRQPLLPSPSNENIPMSAANNELPAMNISTTGPSSVTVIVITSSTSSGNWENHPSYYYQPPMYSMYYPPPGYASPYPYYSPYGNASHQSPGPNASHKSPQNSGVNSVAPGHFFVKFLNGRIKVCAGCKGPHLKGVNNEVLPPPHNMCIVHAEQLTFINPRSGLECSKTGNAHYHVNRACIQKIQLNLCHVQKK